MGNSLKKYSIWINLAVSLMLLWLVFGNILKNPNYVFFSNSGDGLKSTFGSYYHLQYDTAYWHTDAQNYPFGESVFFTGGQPLIINALKLLKSGGIDLSAQMTGILNTWLLLSVVWGALFLFLLLRKLEVPWWYAIAAANIIAFLSPQMGRFGGHFNLAYLYFLPLFLYLLKLFYDKPDYRKSLLIGLVAFLALGTQAYFYAEYAFWIFFLLLYGWFFQKEGFGNIAGNLLHLFIQIGLPFILFNLFTASYPSDRSAFPWGFFESRSFPEAVFLPFDKPYARFIHFSYLKWEGMAFVGMVASLTFIILLYRFARAKFGRSFSGNGFLDALLIGAVVALLVSFAYPFQWDLQWLLKYTGPFRQFRAVGRFNWLFFYTMNITAFYLIWRFYQHKRNTLSKSLLVLALLWGSYDAYLNVRGNGEWLENRIPELQDTQNELPQNSWLKNFDAEQYQAIMALPFYHIGSEVYWIGHSGPTEKTAFITSWKTGLPLIPVMLSRTSISQTMTSLALYFEPLRPYDIMRDFPNRKDLLLIRQKGEELNANEQRMITYALPLTENEQYRALRLPVDSLEKLNRDFRMRIQAEAGDSALFRRNGFLLSRDSADFYYNSFGNKLPDTLRAKNVLRAEAREILLQEIPFSFKAGTDYRISFWMKNMNADLWPRSVLKINMQAEDGSWKDYRTESLFKKVRYVDEKGWGLIELDFQPEEDLPLIRLELWNDLLTGGDFVLDELLLRPAAVDIYFPGQGFIYKNNRFVLSCHADGN
jgi:hypothetical protein